MEKNGANLISSSGSGEEVLYIITFKELKRLLNMSECALFIAKPGAEIEILYANAKFYSMLQYTSKEYHEKFGNCLMAAVLPEEKQKIRNLIARQIAAGGTLHLEFRALRKDGNVLWISLSAHTVMVDGEMRYYSSCMDITKIKKSLDDVYKAKNEMEIIANSIPGGVIKLRMSDRKIIYSNDGYYILSGYSRSEFHMNFGDYFDQILIPADVEFVQGQFDAAIENLGLLGFECRIMSKNNEVKWLYINGRRIDDDNGQPVYLCVIMDITSKKVMEEELEDNARRSELISDYLQETMWTYDIKRKRLSRSGNLGATYSDKNVLEDLFSSDNVGDIIHPDDSGIFEKDLAKLMESPERMRGKYRIKDNIGNYRAFELSMISISSDGNVPDKIYGVTRFIDNAINNDSPSLVNKIHNIENKLVTMAKSAQAKSEDYITGLVPYATFLKKAEKILDKRSESDHYALVCADINEFRKFSHHYGFSISNHILKTFSKILLDNIAKEGMCSRVDGDYFIVLFQYEHHKELLNIMSSMVRSQEEILEKTGGINFGTTTGIYLIQPSDHELIEMLEKADLARRSIKGLMGNHYAIYTDDLQDERFTEEETIEEIYSAVSNKTIEICYMPRICGDKENIIGCKAIPRVQLKDGQYLEADKLYRLIERGGKLDKIAFATLSSVCCSIGAWKKKGNNVIPVSIEMTASEISSQNAVDIIDNIVVRQNCLEPKDIIIEIQERYFAEITTIFEMAIENLVKRGYEVVISRFGSDHTALNSIRRIPVTGIKFHGEYFNENMTSEKEKIIFKKVVEMAKELGLSVTCGGIHTKLQEKFAKEIGCDVFEGDMYYGAVRSNVFEKCFLS